MDSRAICGRCLHTTTRRLQLLREGWRASENAVPGGDRARLRLSADDRERFVYPLELLFTATLLALHSVFGTILKWVFETPWYMK